MITTNTPTSKAVIRNEDHQYNSKLFSSSSSSSPSSVRHVHKEQQLSSLKQQTKCNNYNVDNNKKTMNSNTPKQQRKKQAAPSPAPFLSFQVQNQNCAVYVGNIPIDERSPCKVCGQDFCNNDEENKVVTGPIQDCPCAIELKAFLRDRINAAFKVPVEEIGIRTCRLFSVVTNVYSNNDDADKEGGGEGALKSITANTNANLRQRSGRRVHRAACVEFDDPKIAEHTLALKFTSFHFAGQAHNRSSLRMRRWTTDPPPPPPQSKSLSPSSWGPKNRQPPPPPRSKSVSPKISSSNFKRQQLPPTPPPRPKSMSPDVLGRKQLQRHRKQIMVSSTITERPDSPMSVHTAMEDSSDGGRSSPSCSSCIVHVGNIPAEATSQDLREFFLERMNKAFHGVTPPEIIRLSMRRTTTNCNAGGTGQPRLEACVEFQDPKVAFRATQLKNRRWHARDEGFDGSLNDDEGIYDDDGSNSYEDEMSIGKKRRNAMPLLEIEIWDPTKHDSSDFFSAHDSNSTFGSALYPEGDDEEHVYRFEMREDSIIDPTGKLLSRTSPRASPKSSPLTSNKSISTVEEAREAGFLLCSNPNKTPKCDHLFTIYTQQGEGISCLTEVKKARMCHGYAFRGKVCRNHKKRSGNGKKREVLSGPACPFAHIDSFDQLKDPHDILSLLYYVENNDEVEFIPGTGCTPQEYLSRQREWQPEVEEGKSPIASTQPTQQIHPPSLSTEEILQQYQRNLSSLRLELTTTQQKLHNSEIAQQSLLDHQSFRSAHNATVATASEKDSIIGSLHDEIARLRNALEETNHKWKSSALAAENSMRDYALLQEKYQLYINREGKSHISTELLESEVIKLRQELKKSQADCQSLQEQQKLSSGSNSSETQLEESWPDMNILDNFLERSIPTLMQMTDGNTDERLNLNLPPKPSLTDIPMDCASSLHVPYKSSGETNLIQPTPPGLPGTASPSPSNATTTQLPTTMDEESLLSEISYLVSCYGNQVYVSNSDGTSPTTVTRFLKLPMNLYKGRDIDVALVLTIPKGYPWNGIVKIHSDPRLSNHIGDDSQYRKLVSDSISGLLNVCRWEAEACHGNIHVLVNIMKAAERWSTNDWKIIQKKNWLIDYDSHEDSPSSSQFSASNNNNNN